MRRGFGLCVVIEALCAVPGVSWAQGAPPPVPPVAPVVAPAPVVVPVPVPVPAPAPLALAVGDKALVESAKALGRAEQKAEDKGEEADAEEAKKKAERSAKMLESGLTIGQAAAVLVQLTTGGGGNFDLAPQASVVAMPYLAMFPAYWFGGGPSQRKYCASVFSNTEEDAREAADDIARDQAKVFAAQFAEAYAAEKDAGLVRSIAVATATDDSDVAKEHPQLLAAAQAHARAVGDAQTKAAFEELVRASSADLVGWRMNVDANCVAHKFGLYVGFPANADMDYRYGGAVQGEVSVAHKISMGLAFVPNAWLAILAGYAYGTADVERDDRRASLSVHHLALSIGGNIDALGLLTK